MKRVLVTGATGFIGRHALAALIARGYDVTALTSKCMVPLQCNVRWINADLLNQERVNDIMADVCPSHLLHLAWYTEPGKFWSGAENFTWVQANMVLLKAFARHGGIRVVSAGTCAEYDWNHGYCVEGITPLNPGTVYGVAKNACQELQNAFCKLGGISGAWGRIFHVYGPYEHSARLVPSVIHSLMDGDRALCSHGRQLRDTLHVEDVADAMVALLDSTIEGPVNISSGQPVTLKVLVRQIAEKMMVPEQIQFDAIKANGNDPPLIVGNSQRLTNEVGWLPRYDLDTGLDQTIAWWYKHREIVHKRAA